MVAGVRSASLTPMPTRQGRVSSRWPRGLACRPALPNMRRESTGCFPASAGTAHGLSAAARRSFSLTLRADSLTDQTSGFLPWLQAGQPQHLRWRCREYSRHFAQANDATAAIYFTGMQLSLLIALFQDAPASDGSGTVKIVAGVLALVLVAIIIMRRRGGGKKKEEDEF